jgi:hypothetical protein
VSLNPSVQKTLSVDTGPLHTFCRTLLLAHHIVLSKTTMNRMRNALIHKPIVGITLNQS